jgi:hypothetical protein
MITHVLLTIEHSKPIPELSELVAGRVYTMTNVENVEAVIVQPEQENEK